MDEEAINRVVADNQNNPIWLKILKERIKAEEKANISSRD